MTTHALTRRTIGAYEVAIATGAGPRIVDFRRPGGGAVFADLGDHGIASEAGWFSFIGGHRLWAAPEVPGLTYAPDDDPVVIETDGSDVVVQAAPGPLLAKSIRMSPVDDRLIVTHTLRNDGASTMAVAAWAITQLAVGGTAILPLADTPRDPHGLQAADVVVRWPYTPLDAPELRWLPDRIEVDASDRPDKVKLGTSNPRGWLAYRLGDETFVKWAEPPYPGDRHADLGAAAQCFRDDRFLELETLGPLTTLEPGDSTSHVEVWAMLDGTADMTAIDAAMRGGLA